MALTLLNGNMLRLFMHSFGCEAVAFDLFDLFDLGS